jgi:methylmalonyl-CoA mutase N-terminal domain/subunit
VREALARLKADAEDPTINVMPALIDASRAQVTVGESMRALESVFGTWYERSVV